MIKKLRAKLILASMFSLALVLLIILGGVNLMSYQNVVSDADSVLTVLPPTTAHSPGLREGSGARAAQPPALRKGASPF